MYSEEQRMTSEQDAQYIPDAAIPQPRGRIRSRIVLTIAVATCAIGSVYMAWSMIGTDEVIRLLEEYWPVLIAPIVGIIAGRSVVRTMYRPSGRILVHLDVENHILRAVFVPEDMMRMMEQTGNNVLYHTMGGIPVYLVENLDLINGRIDYGWIHTENALSVMTREDAYRRWYSTLNLVLRENLELMVHPKVIALGYARKELRDHLDKISAALGLTDADYDPHDADESIPEDYLDLTENPRNGNRGNGNRSRNGSRDNGGDRDGGE